jgi:error-prone DNA polymerase
MSFSHLHIASGFSSHYGVNRPELLVETAHNLGFDALAITDRDGLYGAVKHIGACIQVDLAPIVGVDLPVLDEDGSLLARVVVLAHGQNKGLGWATLCAVVTEAHAGGKKKQFGIKRTRLAALASSGVITVLLGPDSDVGKATLGRSKTAAVKALGKWLELFSKPGVLGLEIVSLLTEPGKMFSSVQARRMLELADSLNVPAVLTNSVRYIEPDDAITADILDAARFLEPLGKFEPQPNAQAWLKPKAQMQAVALEITEDRKRARKLLSDTSLLSDLCRLDPVSDCGWGKPKTPEKEALGIEGSPFEVLFQKVQSGVNWRYGSVSGKQLSKIQHRLNQELITINKLGFATYFLTVADVAQMIRDMNIRIAARGSGAGSLVNYLLGISGVDPIEHDLLFERFLSVERSSLPDIDIDVESARRHDIYRAIFKRYGSKRVTLLSMQSTYRGRGAMRDSALALGLDPDQVDSIAESMWRFSASSFRNALRVKPELAEFAQAVEHDRKMNLLVDMTERLDRIPRHISMHPCGVILGDLTLPLLTPVEPSGMGLPMSQFDKDDMDPMGFLKLDVLGVRMQSTMAYAVSEIKRVRGVSLDLDGIAKDDAATFKAIRTTNTLGIFQIESPGQRELTGKHQPTEFNDLTIQISLFRPGPMKGNMILPYLDRRHGFEKPEYIHKDLEPILKETFGVVIFHEHVLRILHVMTGCTLARADELRRSLEKPGMAREIENFFRTSAAKKGYSKQVIDKVWSILAGFGSFGFCKAHGAAFALPTYQSAWLKTHYPAEFLAGVMTHDPGMYPRRLLLAEARRLGVKLLPIDINASSSEFHVEKHDGTSAIRMSFVDLKSISETEINRIISGQPYSSLSDFYLRAKPSRRTFERLALIGAFDDLANGSTRGDVLEKVKELNAIKVRPEEDEYSLFSESFIEQMPKGNPEPSTASKVETELELLNMDISEHALEKYRPMLDELGVVYANELLDVRGKTNVLVAGVRVATQTPPMRSGKRVVFVSLDDGSGCSDSTFFDDAQQRCSHVLFNTKLMLIGGKVRRTGAKGVSIMAENAWRLDELWDQWEFKRKLATTEASSNFNQAS